jgi:phage shock protein C
MNNRKLYRSLNERMIGGVCGGLAEYFDIDPTIIRLAFLLLLIMGGNGLLIYIILLIIMPNQPTMLSSNSSKPIDPNQ